MELMNNLNVRRKETLSFLLLLGNILLIQDIKAQDGILSGLIYNQNKEPIEYASIVFKNKRNGTYSNEKGEFTLKYSNQKDSVAVFALGYILYKSTIQEILEDNGLIILQPRTLEVNETTVSPKEYQSKTRELGFFGLKRNYSYVEFPGGQIAVKIENEGMPTGSIIKQVKFQVKKVGNCHSPLRIRILDVNLETGEPGTDLITDNVVVGADELKRNNRIDISSYRVAMPRGGIFVCIEWLKHEQECINSRMVKRAVSEKSVSPILIGNQELQKVVTWTNYLDRSWSRKAAWEDKQFQGNANIGVTVLIPKKSNESH